MFTFIQNFYSSIFEKMYFFMKLFVNVFVYSKQLITSIFLTPIDFLKNYISSWPNPYHCNRLGSPQTTVLTIPPRQHQTQAIIP